MATVRIILIMAVSLICSPVLSADKDGQYLVSATHEVVSCRGLNSALAKAKSADSWTTLYAYSLYTMGYISGINRLAHDTYDIAGHKNAKTLLVWLERYCAENPADSFDQALFRLTLELFPNRTIAKPE
jgi:hypothetical protein